jgi:uncharacterized protein (TIGR02246 family)
MKLRVGCLILTLAMTAVLCGAMRASDADAIAAVRAEWSKDLHDKKLDAFVALYTPDAHFLIETGERFAGREAIRELTRGAMTTFTSNMTWESKVTEISGEMAYDSGDYHETLVNAADGKELHPRGTYLMVFRRQADGRWLIAVQMWSAVPSSDKVPH